MIKTMIKLMIKMTKIGTTTKIGVTGINNSNTLTQAKWIKMTHRYHQRIRSNTIGPLSLTIPLSNQLRKHRPNNSLMLLTHLIPNFNSKMLQSSHHYSTPLFYN